MKHASESIIILILFLVQFIDVLDFMIVMPLGPDFSAILGIPEHKLGWIAGSYTLTAAFTGLLSSTILDRFERKRVLVFTLLGLVIANILSANAWNLPSLFATRCLAGAFGGPATSICFAVVADLFKESRRGAVMGKIMSGFSLAAIFGVPIGLEMSFRFGWQYSFYTVAALGILAIILILVYLPQLTSHLESAEKHQVTYVSLFRKRINVFTFTSAFLGSVAAFMIIPYISPFLQSNLLFPRDQISLIYFVGGIGSFFAMHLAGKFVDKTSSTLTTRISNIFIVFSLILGFVFIVREIPILIIFSPFMIGMAVRNVSNYTLFSKVPSLNDRAGFMSIISCVQHLGASIGSFITSIILVSENNQLKYMDVIAIIAAALFLIIPLILRNIEKELKVRITH
jgi:predicted MFS family arabinose efflux permease